MNYKKYAILANMYLSVFTGLPFRTSFDQIYLKCLGHFWKNLVNDEKSLYAYNQQHNDRDRHFFGQGT